MPIYQAPRAPSRLLVEMGAVLRAARERRELSSTLLAERVGISTTTLRNLERAGPSTTTGGIVNVLLGLDLPADVSAFGPEAEAAHDRVSEALAALVATIEGAPVCLPIGAVSTEMDAAIDRSLATLRAASDALAAADRAYAAACAEAATRDLRATLSTSQAWQRGGSRVRLPRNPAHRAIAERIGAMEPDEPPHGWEERTMERWRRRRWRGRYTPIAIGRVTRPPARLTDAELAALRSARTEPDWLTACRAIRAARCGQLPRDWADRVIASGLMADLAAGWPPPALLPGLDDGHAIKIWSFVTAPAEYRALSNAMDNEAVIFIPWFVDVPWWLLDPWERHGAARQIVLPSGTAILWGSV